MPSLFQKSVEKKYLKELKKDLMAERFEAFQRHFGNPEIQENIRKSKEEEYQEGFVRDLFVTILGYTLKPQPGFNFVLEKKNVDDAKKADGAVLLNDKPIAVVELKGTDTTDLKSVESQAFGYKNKQPDCKYVITANFEKLRFYINNAVDFEEFNLFNLTTDRFALLWLCLAKDNLLNDLPLKIKNASVVEEEAVTKKLYKDYSTFKHELFRSIVELNPDYDKLVLFKKTQKLLDRLLFIFFAEDRSLLPPNSIAEIIRQWESLKELDAYEPLYDRYKKYFGYLNTGYKKGNYEVFAYNGGLFLPDEVLDRIRIDDELLKRHTNNLSHYDFESEVDVNILGHIFEHSLNELDEIQAELEGTPVVKSKTKRKKDGVFYTPKYITKYIVENTLGRLCDEKKSELGIDKIDFSKKYILKKSRQTEVKVEYESEDGTVKGTRIGKTNLTGEGEKIIDNLEQYRNFLLNLTICDPACGSGAFLNQALDFLINEHNLIDQKTSLLLGHETVFPNTENHILENNLYGVDLNEESVEIARLSLWLRTAQQNRKLTTLSGNIKCGNSLIDDPAVAGDKAFDWKKEFPEVFKKGGFDVVIGNPPYVTGALLNQEKDYLRNNYISAQYQMDLYILFIERTIKIISDIGYISFITPNSWLKNLMMSDCRKFLIDNTRILKIIPNLPAVFEGVNVDSLIFVATKQKIEMNEIEICKSQDFGFEVKHSVKQDGFIKNDKFIFTVEINPELQLLIDKLKNDVIEVDSIFDITRGVNPYDIYTGQEKSIIESKAYHADFKKDETFVPELRGKHIDRYFYKWDGLHYISYGDWLAAPRNPKYFKGKRIIFREILGKNFVCTYIDEDFIIDRSLYIALHTNNEYDCKYVLALLASNLMAFYFRYITNEFDSLFPKIRLSEFKKLPIKKASLVEQKNIIDKADYMLTLSKNIKESIHSFYHLLQSKYKIEKLSTKMQQWYEFDFSSFLKEIKKAKVQLTLSEEAEWMKYFNQEKEKVLALKSEIEKTDREIDQMVYELYGLTEEEIKVVEGV